MVSFASSSFSLTGASVPGPRAPLSPRPSWAGVISTYPSLVPIPLAAFSSAQLPAQSPDLPCSPANFTASWGGGCPGGGGGWSLKEPSESALWAPSLPAFPPSPGQKGLRREGASAAFSVACEKATRCSFADLYSLRSRKPRLASVSGWKKGGGVLAWERSRSWGAGQRLVVEGDIYPGSCFPCWILP